MGDDYAAVRDAFDSLDTAFDRHDLAAILDLCTDDVVFVGSGTGEEAEGRDALEVMLETLAPDSEDTEFTVE